MKKTFFIGLVSFISILMISNSCNYGYEDCHNNIVLKNNSSSTIYYASTLKDNFFNYDPTDPKISADYKVPPKEEKNVKIGITLSCWEQVMESATGYVYIYIYDAAMLESTPWADAKTKYIKKYTLNADQLNKAGWTVAYP